MVFGSPGILYINLEKNFSDLPRTPFYFGGSFQTPGKLPKKKKRPSCGCFVLGGELDPVILSEAFRFHEDSYAWQFFVTFLGWLSDLLERLSDLQLGDKKVTLNHLVEVS